MEVQRLTDWLWCLRTQIVQAYAIRERDGFNLVDTMTAGEEAGVIAGERTAPPPRLADWEVPLFEQVTPAVPPAPPVVPDRLVAPGDRLGWEHDGTIVAAPGHTPGQIAVWLEADRVLLAGDALASHEGRPMVGVFNSEPAVAAASARRLAALDVEIACFGHGEPLVDDAASRLATLLET